VKPFPWKALSLLLGGLLADFGIAVVLLLLLLTQQEDSVLSSFCSLGSFTYQ
jgi:hypothetical protein